VTANPYNLQIPCSNQLTSQANRTQLTQARCLGWMKYSMKGILLLPTTWVLLTLVQCSSQRMLRMDGNCGEEASQKSWQNQ
jgi:hypothetical protein